MATKHHTIGYLLGIPEQDQQLIRDKIDRVLGLKEGTFKTVTANALTYTGGARI